MENRPFVVTVASEKGGVGKTTLATNLAVYLKALREDLPVTIASFDNHFSVDHMFAIGSLEGRSVAGLFRGEPIDGLVQLGEYGVQFLSSERDLQPLDDDHLGLAKILSRSRLPGVLVLDTRPILDYFTRSALLAADLVLVPVKDRPSLINATALQQVLERRDEAAGRRLWLVPSLVDARVRLRGTIGVRDFLVFNAKERGFQVVDGHISKSPKVESLGTNLTSRIYPVLTHARNTAVHSQFRALAHFVLEHFDRPRSLPGEVESGKKSGSDSRLLRECPVCGRGGVTEGAFFQDLRSRRRGLLHDSCWDRLLDGTGFSEGLKLPAWLAVETMGAGLDGGPGRQLLHLFNAAGELLESEPGDADGSDMKQFLRAASGREPAEFLREIQVLAFPAGSPNDFLAEDGRRRFAEVRKRIRREILLGLS